MINKYYLKNCLCIQHLKILFATGTHLDSPWCMFVFSLLHLKRQNESVSKVCELQARGPEFDGQYPCKRQHSSGQLYHRVGETETGGSLCFTTGQPRQIVKLWVPLREPVKKIRWTILEQ